MNIGVKFWLWSLEVTVQTYQHRYLTVSSWGLRCAGHWSVLASLASHQQLPCFAACPGLLARLAGAHQYRLLASAAAQVAFLQLDAQQGALLKTHCDKPELMFPKVLSMQIITRAD